MIYGKTLSTWEKKGEGWMKRRKEAGEKNGGRQGKERKQEEEREPYFK